jgi:hypothetical protein
MKTEYNTPKRRKQNKKHQNHTKQKKTEKRTHHLFSLEPTLDLVYYTGLRVGFFLFVVALLATRFASDDTPEKIEEAAMPKLRLSPRHTSIPSLPRSCVSKP